MRARTRLQGLRRLAGALLFSALPALAQGRDAGVSSPPRDAGLSAPADGAGIPLEERRRIPGRIAFVSERDGNREVYLVRPSGEGETRLTTSPSADYPAAAAPDGSALAIVQAEEKQGLHLERILVQPLDGKALHFVGPRSGRARNPSWAPDGRWLAFESDAEAFAELYRVNRDGSGVTRLTDNREGNHEPQVSPDGKTIAFVSSRDGDPELYRMRADGKQQARLTAFHREDWAPRWSPDGRQLVFLSNREGVDRIFVMDANGTHLRPLSGPLEPKPAAESAPAWSPDGARVAYVARRGGEHARIWLAELRTGAVRALTPGESAAEAPEWSPDGRYLAFDSDRSGDAELYLMRADGSGVTRLTHAPGADWLPRWIPAGRERSPAR